MPEFYIHHRTLYSYPEKVVDSANQIKLYPFNDNHQQVVSHLLKISQQPSIFTLQDYFNNTTGFFSLLQPHQELSIESFLRVQMSNPLYPSRDASSEVWDKILAEDLQQRFFDYLRPEIAESETEVRSILIASEDKLVHPLDSLTSLSSFIYKNFTYKKGVTNIETQVDEIWKLKAGVCQDFAHLLLYMMRLLKIPGRYISGYICPGTSEWRGEGATHAWVEAWLPDLGWVGIDPTNNCLAGERHVRLATGRNFTDTTPVKGTYKGAEEHILEVTVQFSTTEFTEPQLAGILPINLVAIEPEVMARNSYVAYMQMQQQQ